MAVRSRSRERSDRTLIPPLLIGVAGIFGVVALYLLGPGFQLIDLVLLLGVVGFSAAGYNRRIVRGVMTIVMLYIATGVAATFYPVPAPYVGTLQRFFQVILNRTPSGGGPGGSIGGSADRGSLALSFCLLTVVIWAILEYVGRVSFRDTRLPRLGILDNVGGVLVHLVVGALVASLLFNAIGYGRLRYVHNEALLRPRFNQVLAVHYAVQSFWFPGKPPPIYVYDLDLARER